MNRMVAATATLAGALALATPITVHAQEAPPGEAEAVAAEVEGVAAVGHTQAQADEESGEATGNAVELGGEPLGDATGTSQSGAGESESSLIDTDDTPLGRLQVAPSRATVEQSEQQRRANATAALARLILLEPDVLQAHVLESESTATHESGQSTGAGESNGARVEVGGAEGLSLIVLHSETSSQDGGSSYVASINDNQLLTSEDADGGCAVEVPGVVGITCLTAAGGEAGALDGAPQEASAAVAGVDVGDGSLHATVVGGQASAGTGSEVASGSFQPDGGDEAARGGADLPRTGSANTAGIVALALVALGGAVLAVRRRLPGILGG